MATDPVSSSGTTTPASAPEPTAAVRKRAEYDQALANDISNAATLLTKTLASPEALAELSYTATELNAGVDLQKAAQAKFTARQAAIGTAKAKQETAATLFKELREDFLAFRQVVQVNFDKAGQSALAGRGRVPTDVQKFTTLLRSAYGSAMQAPYAAVLSTRKLPASVFTVRLLDVDAFEKASGESNSADKVAVLATQVRNEAGQKMRKWIANFSKQARVDLSKNPELLAELGLPAK